MATQKDTGRTMMGDPNHKGVRENHGRAATGRVCRLDPERAQHEFFSNEPASPVTAAPGSKEQVWAKRQQVWSWLKNNK